MEHLKAIRKSNGISQQAVAEYLGITRQAYCNYENGKREPDRETLLKLAEYFDTTIDYLVRGNEKDRHSDNGDDLTEYLDMLRTRPECRMLFSLAKGATKEDVETAVRIIEAIRKKEIE